MPNKPLHFTSKWAAGLAILSFFLALAASHWDVVDASHDDRAEQFGRMIIAQAPDDVILFAQGDQAIFSLWNFHFALEERADMTVIAPDLLPFAWYQETLKTTDPSLIVPGPYPFPETIAASNPDRPVCYVQYEDLLILHCLP